MASFYCESMMFRYRITIDDEVLDVLVWNMNEAIIRAQYFYQNVCPEMNKKRLKKLTIELLGEA